MFTFIPDIRKDRKNEIDNYKSKGIEFIRENDYKLVENICILKNFKFYNFEVRVDFKEVRFYIIKSNSCIYLSLYEIYTLLNEIYLSSDIDITEELKKIYNNSKDKFICKNKEYEFPECSIIENQYQIRIPNSNLKISYTELLLLVFLIQEKSNYLCSISKDMYIYKNGIINLMITLLNYHDDNTYLKELGWCYSRQKNKYMENQLRYLNKSDEKYEERKNFVNRKYYLTQSEMKSILKI